MYTAIILKSIVTFAALAATVDTYLSVSEGFGKEFAIGSTLAIGTVAGIVIAAAWL